MRLAAVPGEDLRQTVAGDRGGVDERVGDRTGLVVQAVAGQSQRDQGVVVRPDRTAVVRQRVVRRLPGGQGAHTPAGEEVRLQQAVADQFAVLLVEQPRPQQAPASEARAST